MHEGPKKIYVPTRVHIHIANNGGRYLLVGTGSNKEAVFSTERKKAGKTVRERDEEKPSKQTVVNQYIKGVYPNKLSL